MLPMLIFVSGLGIGCGFTGLILVHLHSRDISKLFDAIRRLECEGYPFLREDLNRYFE